MQQFALLLRLASLAALAVARGYDELSMMTSSLRIEGLTHSEHTSDENGDFKHPFLDAAPEVQTIHYPESGSFSTKLHRVKTGSRR